MFFLVVNFALAASDPDTIQRRISANDYEGARRRCEKWDAQEPDAAPALREVCAKADWPLAEARDSAQVWQAYCDKWAETEWATVANERLASASLRELRSRPSEDVLIDLAERFPDTRAAQEALEQAADAAVRDATDGDLARRAARRYPDHPGLPPLVERYPEKFVQVLISEDYVIETSIEPPVRIPPYMEPLPVWIARWPGGHSTPWQEVASNHLSEAGLSPDQIPIAGSGPPLPLCALSGQPEGFHAAVEVRVGAGRLYRPVPWNSRCGPEAQPVVMTVSGGQVVGLSLGPGSKADLSARSLNGRLHTRAFLSEAPGAPVLVGQHLFAPSGRLWLVTPLNGGAPWLTDRAPALGAAIPLSASLSGSGPPNGMRLETEDGTLVLRGDGSEDWVLPPGEVRFLSSMLQQVLGITSDTAAHRPGAPALLAQAPWIRDGGQISSTPPTGGQPLSIEQLSELDVQKAQLRVESAGLSRERADVQDAWMVDIDRDGVVEVIFRARVDGEGALIVLDVHSALGNRLFLFRAEDAAPADGGASAPFAFTYGGHPYFAWTGQNGTSSFIELVRYDGHSMRSERLTLQP
jgi:hypothetical protein